MPVASCIQPRIPRPTISVDYGSRFYSLYDGWLQAAWVRFVLEHKLGFGLPQRESVLRVFYLLVQQQAPMTFLLLPVHVFPVCRPRYKFRQLPPFPSVGPDRRLPWRAEACATMSRPSGNYPIPTLAAILTRWHLSSGWSPTRSPETTSSTACGCPGILSQL